MLRIDEKNIREYSVPNVVGVIITSNYLTDGCYLPPDDRRHYVAWSPLSAGDLSPEYFEKLYRWYDEGGNRHVAAWLAAVNLADFNPKAPPKKTAAFWEVVDAERGGEESEFADIIDLMTTTGGTARSDHLGEAEDPRLGLADAVARRPEEPPTDPEAAGAGRLSARRQS